MTFRSEGEKTKLFQKQCLLPFLRKISIIVKDLRKEGYKGRRFICDVSILSSGFSSSVVLILLKGWTTKTLPIFNVGSFSLTLHSFVQIFDSEGMSTLG